MDKPPKSKSGVPLNPETGKYLTGRPTKYTPEICNRMVEFFNKPRTYKVKQKAIDKQGFAIDIDVEKISDLPTLTKFTLQENISLDTVNEWVKENPEFSEAYKKIKAMQADFLMDNTLNGGYNPTFAIFTAKNVCGWKDNADNIAPAQVNIQVVSNGENKGISIETK